MRRIPAGLQRAAWWRCACVAITAATLASGCTRTVQLEVPAQPAWALTASRVAVVSADRSCKDVADALVKRLNDLPGMHVDPQAPLRVHAVACGRSLSADVLVDVEQDRRRVSLTGRAHALLTVVDERGAQAHLLGSAEHADLGTWGELDLLGRGRSVDRSLSEAVAGDLAHQLNPLPTIAARRVFPGARPGSVRRLRSDAVAAELSGDLQTAHQLAVAAYTQSPSPAAAAYVRELQRRIYLDPTAPPPH